jgi:hypothetical protein
LFELHLRTAIPEFRLDAPYTVMADPAYRDHLRVTVKTELLARLLTAAWGKNTVAGYSRIKMVEMTSAIGNQRVENNSHSGSGPGANVPSNHNYYNYNTSASSNRTPRLPQSGRR